MSAHRSRGRRPTLINRGIRPVAAAISLTLSVALLQGAELALSAQPAAAATGNTAPTVPTGLSTTPWFLNPYSQQSFSSSATPTLRATASDPDGGSYRAEFEISPDPASADTSYAFTALSGAVSSGTLATLAVPEANALPNGKHLRLRVRAYDGTDYSGWSAYTSFISDSSLPAAPTVSCTGVPADTWTSTVPAGTQCTLATSSTDGQGYSWGLDDPDASTRLYDTESGTGGHSLNVAISPAAGWHTLYARTVDAAGNLSTATTAFSFGVGADGASLLSPMAGAVSARRTTLSAKGSPNYSGVAFEYRFGETDSWKAVPASDVVKASDGSAVTWPLAVSSGNAPALSWDIVGTIAEDGPVQVRAKFTATGATGYSPASTVTVDRRAGTAPRQQLGPGSLNTLTGDYILSATDTAVFGVGVARTASSRQPDAGATQEGQAPIFGPQWSTGVVTKITDANWSEIQQTSASSAVVVTSSGDRLGFTATSGGGWEPQPGAEDLTLTGSFGGSFTLKDGTGRTATFSKVDGAATTWTLTTTYLATSNSTTTVVAEKTVVDGKTLARPRYVVAPTTAVTADVCAATPSTKGCRVLEYVYAATTTATGSTLGDFAGQVKEVRAWATTPGAAAATSEVVAAYSYDSAGQLREAWDPRLATPLKTAYTYTGGRVTTLTPPGELPWTLTYGNAGSSSTAGDGMLLSVSRPTLTPGSATQTDGTAVSSVVYDVRLSGANAPYQLRAADVAAWNQRDVPADATAVFPADVVPSSHSGADLAAGDYRRATVVYADADGREVNTAAPGGYISTNQYDRFGNTVRSLSAANRAVALGLTPADQAVQRDLGLQSLASEDRAELLEDYTYFDPTGVRALETFGPVRRVDLTSDFKSGSTVVFKAGTSVAARSWAVKEYDTGRPTDGSAKVQDLLTITNYGLRVTGYDSILADKRVDQVQYNWTSGLPIIETRDSGGLGISTGTGYDAQGRIVNQVLPGATSNDAGAKVTVYWSAAGTGWCKGRPEWADQVCWTGPAGDITGGGTNPVKLPDTSREYNRYGQPSVTIDTSGSAARTTRTTYDAAGREATVTVTGNLGQAQSATTTTYDPATGRAAATTMASGGTVSRSFDKLGRLVSYTDADGGTTTTVYDHLDRIVSTSDNVPSITAYTYDLAAEPRGLPVKAVDSVAGTFTATYNAAGEVGSQQLPGGYTLKLGANTVGQPVSRVYTRDSDGSVVASDNVTRSIHGQVTTHSNSAIRAAQVYGYDKAGRLVQVQDTTAADCALRTYTYDKRANRTAQTAASTPAGSPCPTAPDASVAHAYDSADRLVDTGYVYDAFGRTTSTPGSTTAYYVGDLAFQQTAGTTRQTWSLDPSLRRRAATTESNASGSWAQTGVKTNHYAADNDSPRWVVEDGAGTVTRNVTGVDGSLAATTGKSGGTVLFLTNIHGDVNVVLPLDSNVSPVVLDSDELGRSRETSPSARYGWLGGFQRSAETPSGQLLMGERLYDGGNSRFLSIDPVYGGNTNAYEYCSGDPVNCTDLDGRWSWSGTRYFDWGRVWAKIWTAGWGSTYGYMQAQAVFSKRWTQRIADYAAFLYGPAAGISAIFGPPGAVIGAAILVIGSWVQGTAYWARNRGQCLAINAGASLMVSRWTQVPYYAYGRWAYPWRANC